VKPKLDTQFDCPFCNSAKCIEVKMSRPEQLGQLKCRVCNVQYQTRINYLNEAVDVYSEWIDEAAERQRILDQKKKMTKAGVAPPEGVPGAAGGAAASSTVGEKRPGFTLVDDEELDLRHSGKVNADEFEDPEF